MCGSRGRVVNIMTSENTNSAGSSAAHIKSVESLDQSNEMERGLKNRHVQFIAIGGTIGTGLFLGSGKSIALTGPSIIFVYIGVGLIMFLLMRAIGEMMYSDPSQHTFINFITRYLGRGWGKFAGWTYWIVLILTGMTEITAVSTYFVTFFGTFGIDLNSWKWLIELCFLVALTGINLIAVKVFGKDLYESQKLAVQIDKILGTVEGIEDLGVIRNIGQPELRIELDEQKLARYGVAKEDVQSIIEMAIGGKSASLLYEDERKFNIMVRYNPEFRQNEDQIGKILVPASDGAMIPVKELADIRTITGPLLIFRDNHTRFCAVKFSVRGRDMGTAVAEAQKKVNAAIHLPEGYSLKWTGDFENQQRASKRLAQVVPVSIAIIFVILFVLFSNARDAGLVLLNVPFAAVGGIAALLLTGFNFSISAGIGFIALFGICIQNGVIMISDIKHNLHTRLSLPDAVKTGMRSRIRSIVMTAAMAAIGLMPAAMSHGIGSESQRPLAIVIIGGLIGATFFALFVFPLIVEWVYSKMLYDKEGNLLQRKL